MTKREKELRKLLPGQWTRCPKCGELGQRRRYSKRNPEMGDSFFHEAKRGLFGFVTITKSCDLKPEVVK